GNADLAGQEHVLLGLRHRAVGRGDHQDGAVHLRRTGDHVLDVVGVTRAVDVRVVPRLGLVLDVRDGDRDPAVALLRRLVDVLERREGVEVRVLVVEHLGDRRGKRRLTVVDVSNGADVHVRLRPLELGLRHWLLLVAILGRLETTASMYVLVIRAARAYSPRALATISCATFEGTSA